MITPGLIEALELLQQKYRTKPFPGVITPSLIEARINRYSVPPVSLFPGVITPGPIDPGPLAPGFVNSGRGERAQQIEMQFPGAEKKGQTTLLSYRQCGGGAGDASNSDYYRLRT